MRASLWLLLALVLPVSAAGEDTVNFSRDVLPLLSGRCFRCHGPDQETRQAGLRLDDRTIATQLLESGERSIVPGDPGAGSLLARITSEDESVRMPPPEAGQALKPEEVDLLKRWIEQGAKYDRHWSYNPPQFAGLPAIQDATWPQRPLDRFVLARLEQEQLAPVEEADRYALIRRVTLDLIGLPPTLEELDEFVNDPRPDAYEHLVNRLLASPAFGERWGRVWLDLARYADSAGYAQDPERVIWRYRDWVIGAYNANLPFDQFTVEQLAGDMLPNPSTDQMLATAFHRNTLTNSEGGTDDEEFRNAAIVDRVNTTMQVWMGMTMGCAQCHTHKYDPITQEEYFRFYAIFNQTEDADRGDESPTIETPTLGEELARQELLAEVTRLEDIVAKEPKPETVVLPTGDLKTRFVRVEFPGKQQFLSLAEVQVFVNGKNVATTGKATQVSTDYDGPAELAIDGNTSGEYFAAKSTTHTKQADDPWWEVELQGAAPVEEVVVWNRTDGNLHVRLHDFRVIGLDEKRLPLWIQIVKESPNPSVTLTIPADAGKYDAAQKNLLTEYQRNTTAPLTPAQKQLEAAKKRVQDFKFVRTPIVRELPAAQQRKTQIQLRGNFLDKGAEVQPGVPAAFHPLPDGVAANRLNVARWIVSADNPLTARVVVNRYWEELFGTGIVETSEDFGIQGEQPTHPELLDYLALQLIEHGWDTKWLLREILLSATYRQSSRVSEELRTRDPFNRLLARGPRFRLSAEVIRDQALAASGLLSQKIGGPSVRPPRPRLGLNSAFGGSTDWETSAGEDRYRRGLYTSWRRTTPYPSMMTFDAPSREICTIRRIRTNTPLQALVTLNDPVYVEASQALARRVALDPGLKTDAERATRMFRLCLSRVPTEAELGRMVQLIEQLRQEYATQPQEAMSLATDPLGPLPQGADAVNLAAWTVLGNVVLNLDEVVAKR